MLKKLLARAWNWTALGWGSVSLLGVAKVLQRVPSGAWRAMETFSTLKTFWDMTSSDMNLVLVVVDNPFFGPFLIVAGLIGIPAATKISAGGVISRYWAIAGWAVFVLTSSLVMASFVVDSVLTGPQAAIISNYFTDTQGERHLAKDTSERLKIAVANRPQLLAASPLFIGSSTDDNSQAYEEEIFNALSAAGLHMTRVPDGFQTKTEHGIMISIMNPEAPSTTAQAFMELLTEAGIPYAKEVWHRGVDWPTQTDFLVFVTRERDSAGR
jgi:hypothetical protein